MRLVFLFAIAIFFARCGSNEPHSQSGQAPMEGQPQYSTTYLDNKKRKEQAEPPNITIQVQGLASGIAQLVGTFEDHNYRADSALISPTGQIVFKRQEPYFPGLFYLMLPGDVTLHLFFDLDQTFTMTTTVGNPFGDMKVEGSVDNQLMYDAFRFEDGQVPFFFKPFPKK